MRSHVQRHPAAVKRRQDRAEYRRSCRLDCARQHSLPAEKKDHERWKSGIIDSFRDGDRPAGRSTFAASLRSQLGENQARVTAAAKGTINVDTVRTNILNNLLKFYLNPNRRKH